MQRASGKRGPQGCGVSAILFFGPIVLLCAAGIFIATRRLHQGWKYGRYWVGSDSPRKVVTKADRPKTFWAVTALFASILLASIGLAISLVFNPSLFACDWSGACL